jgi:hypothetical protein
VGLQGLPDGGHVVGPAEVLADQAVEAAAGRVLLGRLGPGHHVGDQVGPGAGDLTQVDLGDARRVGQQQLDLAVGLGAPEAGLGGQGAAEVTLGVQQPGPAGVAEERLPVVAEHHLLAELEAVDGRVPADPGALPPADQEGQRGQVRVQRRPLIAGRRVADRRAVVRRGLFRTVERRALAGNRRVRTASLGPLLISHDGQGRPCSPAGAA